MSFGWRRLLDLLLRASTVLLVSLAPPDGRMLAASSNHSSPPSLPHRLIVALIKLIQVVNG